MHLPARDSIGLELPHCMVVYDDLDNWKNGYEQMDSAVASSKSKNELLVMIVQTSDMYLV
jgi:hypothetical protein